MSGSCELLRELVRAADGTIQSLVYECSVLKVLIKMFCKNRAHGMPYVMDSTCILRVSKR